MLDGCVFVTMNVLDILFNQKENYIHHSNCCHTVVNYVFGGDTTM